MERRGAARSAPLTRWVALLVASGCADPRPGGVEFVGDVSLARGVAEEAARSGDPWRELPVADGVIRVGNLEGSVAAGPCVRTDGLCLAIAEADLDWLRSAGFAVMSLANNHALDHGREGLAATVAALEARGMVAVTADRPAYLDHGGRTWAFVGIHLAHPDHQPDLDAGLRQVATARARTPWVVALVHDGIELVDRPTAGQEAAAAALRAHGAALVVTAHAHVPQPVVCDGDGLVAYGLGNHLFDQRPEVTWTGLALACAPDGDALDCRATTTRRDARSTYPRPGPDRPERCVVRGGPIDGRWAEHPDADALIGAAPLPAVGPDAFFALRWQHSPLDGARELRPYVFEVGPDGAIRDRWRGTALGWPLVAARVVDGAEGRICTLHRDDGPMRPDPTTLGRRWQGWRWNGFGFDAHATPCAP